MAILDDELIRVVGRVRAATGTCTYTDLQRETGLSRGTLQKRVRQLKETGRLLATSRPGSMRVPTGPPSPVTVARAKVS